MTPKHIITRFHLFLFVVLLAVTAVAFFKIPAESGLPVHWGFDGKPDQVWPRNPALAIFPACGLFVLAVFAAIGQFAPPEQVEPGRYVSEAALSGLLGLFCALQFALILIGIGSEIDMIRIVAFAIAALLLLLGNALPKSQPNAYAGVRLPWTMGDPANWTATHRLTGILMIVGGLGLALVAWLWPDPANLLLAMAAALFVPVIVGAAFSAVRRNG